jgi:uncharacterized YccA/Bax inhibitor family protein
VQTSNPLLKRAESFSGTAEAVMDLNGTVTKSGILLLICMATAAWAWKSPELRISDCGLRILCRAGREVARRKNLRAR